MHDFIFTYYCWVTNALSITVQADSREDADDLVDDILRQAQNLGISMPGIHTFQYVTKTEIKQ